MVVEVVVMAVIAVKTMVAAVVKVVTIVVATLMTTLVVGKNITKLELKKYHPKSKVTFLFFGKKK